MFDKTHTQRQAALHDFLPRVQGDGDTYIVYGEEKNCLYWADYSNQDRINSLVSSRRAQRTNQERIPFIFTLWVPIYLHFNSQQGPPLSVNSGFDLDETGHIRTVLFGLTTATAANQG